MKKQYKLIKLASGDGYTAYEEYLKELILTPSDQDSGALQEMDVSKEDYFKFYHEAFNKVPNHPGRKIWSFYFLSGAIWEEISFMDEEFL